MATIDVSALTKDYGPVRALDGIDFSVASGEVFGFLGPNGAGKTTTIRTLLGLVSPTAGTARVLGADVADETALVEAKRRIGYLPHPPAFDETVTGREVLDLHASIKGDERRDELLELFDPPLDRRVREYSTGNVQKLGLVQAFMHGPDLVVMDEPTSGLDPLLQRRFDEFVRREGQRGTTLFLSSHALDVVRRTCDRVGIIRDGRLVATESLESLLSRSGKLVRLRAVGDLTSDAFDAPGVRDLTVTAVEAGAPEGTLTEVAFTYTGDVNALVDRLAGRDLRDLDVEEAPLEEVFMGFYGGESGA